MNYIQNTEWLEKINTKYQTNKNIVVQQVRMQHQAFLARDRPFPLSKGDGKN